MSFTWKADRPLRTREQIAREVHQVSLARGLDELASVMALMCISVESDFWCPGNDKDPCFHANPAAYPHDSLSNDGYSSGYYQQQMSGPGITPAWGWGGLWGDPEGTRRRMDLRASTDMFLAALPDDYGRANSAVSAGEVVANVQKPDPKYRYRYATKWDEAWALLRRALNEQPATTPEVPVPDNRPDFNEFPFFLSGNSSARNVANIDLWLMHTQEPPKGSDNRNDAALELRNFLESTKGSDNPVSYHYTGSMANDGGTTVVDCLDTDDASWSVGASNGRSINFCFAGSRSDWTRQQWLDNERGTIAGAAYLFVQDCAKYPKLKARVIAPNYSAPPGAADHNYCTEFLKDGNNHTDVGPNFPWDVFAADVAKYANETPAEPEFPAVKRFPDDWTDRELSIEILRQLRGPTLTGWQQLDGKSLVDAVASIKGDLDEALTIIEAAK